MLLCCGQLVLQAVQALVERLQGLQFVEQEPKFDGADGLTVIVLDRDTGDDKGFTGNVQNVQKRGAFPVCTTSRISGRNISSISLLIVSASLTPKRAKVALIDPVRFKSRSTTMPGASQRLPSPNSDLTARLRDTASHAGWHRLAGSASG